MRVPSPGIKSPDVHDETEAQRLFLGVALGDAQEQLPPGLLENRNPLLTGKKTGKFSDFSRFLRKSVRKPLGIQLFTDEFPSKQNRESIRDNRETDSREQGMSREFRGKSDPLAATHPMASKCFLLVDNK